jgi:TRAP-type C4-dicarboxylate transport system permease small subunit
LSPRTRTVIGIILVAGMTIYGAVMLGLGVSGFSPANDVGDTSSALAETIVGVIFLLLFPVCLLFSVIGRRRHRRRQIRAALGELACRAAISRPGQIRPSWPGSRRPPR